MILNQLALKHRINKSQRQRIIAFVASPINETEMKINKIAEKLKKNNVAVDIVHFGEISDANKVKLQGFISKVNNSDNSNYLIIEPTLSALSDCLLETPIIGSSGGARGGQGDFNNLDFDPSQDPELAMALRISLEEARAKEKKEQEEAKQDNPTTNVNQNQMETERIPQQMENNPPVSQPQVSVPNTLQQTPIFQQPQEDDLYEDDMDDEEILRKAMELSMQENSLPQNSMQEEKMKAEPEPFNDPSFVNEMLSSVGIDPNDPKMKEALEKLGALPKKEEEEKKGDKK